MALYNEILAGRFNRFLNKLFNMKGGPPAAQLQGDIGSTISFFIGPETYFHQGWNMYGAFSSTAAVAAQFGAIQLRNPTASGVVAVILKAFFTNTVGAADQPYLQVGPRITDLTTVNALTLARFDPRNTAAQSAMTPSSQTNAAQQTLGATATKWQGALALNASVDIINSDLQTFPLLPGDVLLASSNIVNQALNFAFWWMERPLEDSEKF